MLVLALVGGEKREERGKGESERGGGGEEKRNKKKKTLPQPFLYIISLVGGTVSGPSQGYTQNQYEINVPGKPRIRQ